jgi:hypothetical protein
MWQAMAARREIENECEKRQKMKIQRRRKISKAGGNGGS